MNLERNIAQKRPRAGERDGVIKPAHLEQDGTVRRPGAGQALVKGDLAANHA
jgi:hypothetical protein